VTANVNGGLPSYQYRLDDGPFQDSPVFADLTAGTYTITAKDALGEEATSSPIVIMQPEELTADLLLGVNEITVIASGGAGGYMYSLDGVNYSSIGIITATNGQSFTFFVKDQNECVLELEEYTICPQGCTS